MRTMCGRSGSGVPECILGILERIFRKASAPYRSAFEEAIVTTTDCSKLWPGTGTMAGAPPRSSFTSGQGGLMPWTFLAREGGPTRMARTGPRRSSAAAAGPPAGAHGARLARPPARPAIVTLAAGRAGRACTKGRDPPLRDGSKQPLGEPYCARHPAPRRPGAEQAADWRRLAKSWRPIVPRRRLDPLPLPACARGLHRGAPQ